MLETIDAKSLLLIIHVFGATLGVGGAVVSDLLFLKAARDGVIQKVEAQMVFLGSMVVWGGLLLLVISGASIFALSPETYATSNKFLAKMTIVGILVLNAIIFHSIHIPRIRRQLGKPASSSISFTKFTTSLLISGVLSLTSWFAALSLGSLDAVPLSYATIMLLYACFFLASLAFGFLVRPLLFPR